MSNKTTFDLEGTQEVLEALDALDYKELVKVIRNVEQKALRQNIISPLRAIVGSYHPNVKPDVGIEFAGGTMFKAGVKMDNRNAGTRPPDAVLLRWFDKGTQMRTTKKGYNRGKMTGQHKVQDMILGNVDGVISFFNDDFGTEVDKILQRKLNKMNK